ncbi:conserved hypothetical protein [Flavobacterium sp. 9AF]|uniref:hypothetical protein n=1 Tax=Flavobacterium sp. 9AF TaxID=2653142 RepID=UPI0012F1C889|nr:hypothetical protein [Flavobacterium sp. 9AF]VXB22589.1 conserved hypothetical protein [Flavobacterium sp. 9AF]
MKWNKWLIILFFILVLFENCFSQEIENISKQKAVEIIGSFSTYGSYYNVNGIDPRRKDFSWYLTGSPVLKLYGVEIPFSFTVSEQERTFRQPFNQFALSPSYKWAKLHLGYSNLSWSPFTWSGQTVMGGGVELNPDKFRFGLLYGRLNRAVEEDLTSPEAIMPTFKRIGYAMRLGYGTETSHVDFIYLKGKDDQNSLQTIPTLTQVLPSENIVAGISSKLKLTNHLFWDVDVASSIFTRDINAQELDEDSPLQKFTSLINANSSSQWYNAYQSEIRYEENNYKIKAKYRRVEPDFQSMGSYYFQTDIQNITLEPSAYFLNKKLKINASAGQQTDNLLNKKAYTTKRFIGNIGLDWNLNKFFGFNLLYANFSGEQGKGLKIPNQATQQSFVSQNIVALPRFTFVKEKFTHFHTILLNKQWMTDRNPNTAILTDYEIYNINHNSNIIFNKSGLTFGINYILSHFDSEANNNRLNGIGINVSKPFLNNQLTTSFTGNATKQLLNKEEFANIFNFSLQSNYKINDHHGLALMGMFLDNQSKNINNSSFREFNIDLGYTYTF